MKVEKQNQLNRLQNIMYQLRSEEGCPWDREQTHASLVSCLLEECHELVYAIESKDEKNLIEELGDVLLQVVFHSQIAEEEDRFDLEKVAKGISDKLVRRHPHVFGDEKIGSSEEVLNQWEKIKKLEKKRGETAYLDSVGIGLPALIRSFKLQKKVSKVGFDWNSVEGVIGAVREELGEVEEEIQAGDRSKLAEELGDLMFSVTNLVSFLDFHPELLLLQANRKFEDRFGKVEKSLESKGISLNEASIEQMEFEWQESKKSSL